jgi:hypothetical protein
MAKESGDWLKGFDAANAAIIDNFIDHTQAKDANEPEKLEEDQERGKAGDNSSKRFASKSNDNGNEE